MPDHPLIDRLTGEFGFPVPDHGGGARRLSRRARDHVLFIPGDPVRNLETTDVAVILPELQQAFQGAFDCAVVDDAIEADTREMAGVYKTPSLIFYRDGQQIGALPKVRDWSDYMARIAQILAARTEPEAPTPDRRRPRPCPAISAFPPGLRPRLPALSRRWGGTELHGHAQGHGRLHAPHAGGRRPQGGRARADAPARHRRRLRRGRKGRIAPSSTCARSTPRTARLSPMRWARARSPPSIRGIPATAAQETRFAGVWVLTGADQDTIEVAAIPDAVRARAFTALRPGKGAERRAAPPSSTPRRSMRNWPTRPRRASHGRDAACGELHPPAPYRGRPHMARRRTRRRRGHDPQPGLRQLPGDRDGAPGVWRVQFFNSMDTLILDTLEVTDMPEVVLAAPEDLSDSARRLVKSAGGGHMNAFEGGYHHSDTGLSPQAVLECKICWTVYDPAKGCDFRQIDPGTPFTALPEDWTCPTCGAEKTQFLVQSDPGAPAMLEEAMGAAPARWRPSSPRSGMPRCATCPWSTAPRGPRRRLPAHEGTRLLGVLVARGS
jgi:hydrogenase-1 operon protein HyaE